MLEKSFEKLYLIFRANYYKRMVEKIGTREGSLSATESYCVEIIYLLDRPTISQFAKFLNISVPNANYKINSLVDKGYVTKEPSTEDRREHHLAVTEKFLDYYRVNLRDNMRLMDKLRANLSEEELDRMDAIIRQMIGYMEEDA